MTKLNRHQPDYVLLSIATVLLIFGLVMLASASAVISYQNNQDSYFFFKKQLLGVTIGLIAALVGYLVPMELWRRWSPALLLLTVILLLVVFLPGIGSYYLGARRWIHIGPMLFQPSELAKFALVLYLAGWLERRQGQLHDLRRGFLPYLSIVGVMAALIISQPDLGTTMVIVLVAVMMYFAAGGRIQHLAALGAIGAVLLGLIIKAAPYRAQRFTVFLNPALDPQGIGYHINQALLAVGSGGWFGLGLGHSRQKFNYLPEAAGDSIFAITAEELGFVVGLLFIAGWMMFIWRSLTVAKHAANQYEQWVAIGLASWLGWQAFINIGALTGIMPLTGIPLPLMSYGSSAMVMNLLAIGVLLNISRSINLNARRR